MTVHYNVATKDRFHLHCIDAVGFHVEVSPSDSGTGIPNHKLSEIFDTFYRTKEKGTDLGLSVARTIVETYGGKIGAESRAGGGAVFRFTLPLIDHQISLTALP